MFVSCKIVYLQVNTFNEIINIKRTRIEDGSETALDYKR